MHARIRPLEPGYERLRRLFVPAFGLAVAMTGLGSVTAWASVSSDQGVFTVIHSDTKPGADRPDATLYYLRSASGLVRLRFSHIPHIRPGRRIRVTGTTSKDGLAVQSVVTTGSAVAPVASGTQSVLIMMVDWTAPDSMTPAQATAQVGSADNAWYNGTSYGQLGLSATATPWMTIADPTQGGTTCDLGQIELEAEAAATAQGYSPASYDHEMIYIPIGTPGCNVWAGQGEVSGRITWIYGYMDTRVTTHELGHNLGLWHSHSLTCHDPTNPSIFVPFSSVCDAFSEYGDTWDDMGNCCFTSTPGQFNAEQKQNLGWMQGRVATAATGTQTFTISPLEQLSSAVQAVKITAGGNTYWLDYRQPLNQDSYLSAYPGVTDGVEIHMPQPADGSDGSDLLDMTPDGSFYNEALSVGGSWTTPEGVVITVSSATPAGASVTIKVPAPPPPAGSPSSVAAQFVVPSVLSADASPTDPYLVSWVPGTCKAGSTYTVFESVNGGTATTAFSGTPTSTTLNLLIGNQYTVSVACGGAATSTTFGLASVQQTAATYTGTWTTSTFAGAYGGTAKYSTAKNASASYTCNCEAIAWVTDEDANHGSAKVYIDGVLKTTVNTHNATSKNRVVVYKYGWASDGTHTIKIVNAGTRKTSRVTIDAFLTRRENSSP